jgi:acyl carrier protein
MKKLMKLMADVLRIQEDKITDELSINNTDTWDSLKHMELIVGIEQTFDIRLTADEIVSMVNISEIKSILKNKGVEA